MCYMLIATVAMGQLSIPMDKPKAYVQAMCISSFMSISILNNNVSVLSRVNKIMWLYFRKPTKMSHVKFINRISMFEHLQL